MPFKANQDRRHHIPKQRHRVTNLAAYDLALRQRGNLTVWFTEAAIAAWKAEPRATRGGQPRYSALAITTALTLRAVFRLALRQTEGLIASILRLLGLDLGAAPDHSTMSRRGETLPVSRPRPGSEPVHLLVDSTGLKLCGPGEWLVDKHATRTRRSWRKLHIGVDADTGQIIAVDLTSKDVDDGSQAGPSLEQIAGPVASFTGNGAYDRDDVYREVCQRHPDAAVIVPPRSSAVPSATAETAPTKRDRHLQLIAERGRMGWQRASGYNWRALVEADIGRYKRVIGDALRSRTEGRQTTEVARRGTHLGLLADQKLNDGIPVPFFGRPAMTAPALAVLALRFDCDVLLFRVERLDGARFRVTVFPSLPLTRSGEPHADAAALMVRVNALLETWIRDRPEQWLWLHRRWPD
jgi:Transposase DDE domain/Bacterial lipid A biosynthesis acyltransferase